jgi:hypothetical protein
MTRMTDGVFLTYQSKFSIASLATARPNEKLPICEPEELVTVRQHTGLMNRWSPTPISPRARGLDDTYIFEPRNLTESAARARAVRPPGTEFEPPHQGGMVRAYKSPSLPV